MEKSASKPVGAGCAGACSKVDHRIFYPVQQDHKEPVLGCPDDPLHIGIPRLEDAAGDGFLFALDRFDSSGNLSLTLVHGFGRVRCLFRLCELDLGLVVLSGEQEGIGLALGLALSGGQEPFEIHAGFFDGDVLLRGAIPSRSPAARLRLHTSGHAVR